MITESKEPADMPPPPNLYKIEQKQADGTWTAVPETGAFADPELAKKSLRRLSASNHTVTWFRITPVPFSFDEPRDYEFSAKRLHAFLIANACPIETVAYRKQGFFEVTFTGTWNGLIFPEWENRPVSWTMKPTETHSLKHRPAASTDPAE